MSLFGCLLSVDNFVRLCCMWLPLNDFVTCWLAVSWSGLLFCCTRGHWDSSCLVYDICCWQYSGTRNMPARHSQSSAVWRLSVTALADLITCCIGMHTCCISHIVCLQPTKMTDPVERRNRQNCQATHDTVCCLFVAGRCSVCISAAQSCAQRSCVADAWYTTTTLWTWIQKSSTTSTSSWLVCLDLNVNIYYNLLVLKWIML